MNTPNRELSFYIDTLVVEAIIGDPRLYKHANAGGLVSSLIDKVKVYVGNNIDQNDKAGSLMNILGPGVIFTAFRSFGFTWLGALISLAMRVFHIDVASMIRSIWDQLNNLISGDRQVTSGQVDSIVQSVAQEHMRPLTEEDAAAAQQLLTKSDYNELMKDTRLIKLTMIEYVSGNLKKEAGFSDALNNKKAKTTNILARIFGWVIKVGLSAAGLMVAGDVVNKFLDRPNAFDGTVQNGKPVEYTSEYAQTPSSTTTQTKFKVKSSYRPEGLNSATPWTVGVANNVNSINSMLTQFAKDVYDGLDGKESIITNTAGFRAIADRISFFNRTSQNSPYIWIPPEFKSKKQMVDYFIDDVAEKAVS